MSILHLVFTQKPYIHIKSPDLTFYRPPPNNSILPRTFTLHTNTCQASKLKTKWVVLCSCIASFRGLCSQFSRKSFSLPPPPIFVVQALKAHWKAALRRVRVCVKCCNCCSLPLGTSCYAANGPSAALARVGCPNTEAQFKGRGEAMLEEKFSAVKVKHKGISGYCTLPYFYIAKACNPVEMHVMTWDVRTSESLWLNRGVLLLVRSWGFAKVWKYCWQDKGLQFIFFGCVCYS